MKKTLITTFLIAGSLAVTLNNANVAPCEIDLGFKNISAITLGYDKSMSEKTIKAAVIDSYFIWLSLLIYLSIYLPTYLSFSIY